jgi:hypothetical protein
MITRYSSPLLASRHQKGKRRSSAKERSLIVAVVFVFLIFTARCFFITHGEASIAARSAAEREGKGHHLAEAPEEETHQTHRYLASHFGTFVCSRAHLGADEFHGTKQTYS